MKKLMSGIAAAAALVGCCTQPCNGIKDSGKPLNWFKRDVAHNDDRGKQLIAQRLAAYFLSCAWPCE